MHMATVTQLTRCDEVHKQSEGHEAWCDSCTQKQTWVRTTYVRDWQRDKMGLANGTAATVVAWHSHAFQHDDKQRQRLDFVVLNVPAYNGPLFSIFAFTFCLYLLSLPFVFTFCL